MVNGKWLEGGAAPLMTRTAESCERGGEVTVQPIYHLWSVSEIPDRCDRVVSGLLTIYRSLPHGTNGATP